MYYIIDTIQTKHTTRKRTKKIRHRSLYNYNNQTTTPHLFRLECGKGKKKN